ncbi:MAG TPA: hypothetical protein VN892_11845 [Solirubrobacteraceae bacterium]|nr:hypothetical protein [Solirubrobacteraceae bacterium]
MRRLVHANCFVPARTPGDVLLTDEALVAAAAPPDLRVIGGERRIDADLAHATSLAMFDAAFDWFRTGREDPTTIDGVSAGDLAGAEAALAILMPAARGALAMAAALEGEASPASLVSVVPAGEGRYARLETLAADAADAAARVRVGPSLEIERMVSDDPRNVSLRNKYARVRDPDLLAPTGIRQRIAQALTLGAVNLCARLRRRGQPALLVVEYNPTRAFARLYGARKDRHWRMICTPGSRRDLFAIAIAGDGVTLLSTPDLGTPRRTRPTQRPSAGAEELNGSELRVAGVDLWQLVREPLLTLLDRYHRYVKTTAAPLADELQRRRVRAVLVPFDFPPQARLLVRVAQAIDIPTFVINDGFKSDDVQCEGMAADVALAWSQAMREGYFSRRPDGAIVTGNPRAQRLARVTRRAWGMARVLVGGHAYSPVDLNCRRSDGERFLDEVLAGIGAAQGHVSHEVRVKLHGIDDADYYRECLARHVRLEVTLQASGDVLDLFEHYDLYIATHSTSLIEAAAAGLPVIYYQVTAQRLGPPFSDDAYLGRRTASTPEQLARLLCDRDVLATAPPQGWVERYLGPTTGSVDRILTAIGSTIGARHPQASRYECATRA